MKCYEVPTLTLDIPDLPTRGIYELDAEDAATLTFSPEDDDKITRASRRGLTAVNLTLAGDPAGFEELRRLHVTMWKVTR